MNLKIGDRVRVPPSEFNTKEEFGHILEFEDELVKIKFDVAPQVKSTGSRWWADVTDKRIAWLFKEDVIFVPNSFSYFGEK